MPTKQHTPKRRYALSVTLVIVFTFLIVISPNEVKAQTDPTQQAALVDLYNATDGPNWANNLNWLSGDASTWAGVTVVGADVTEINLPSNFMTGSLPASMGDLTALTTLDLSDNALNGTIPIEIGDMIALATLNFSNNQLTGSIPAEFTTLAALTTLNLHNNQLSGNIPIELGNLTGLQVLDLSINQLTGNIPTELGNIFSLLELDLSSNNLSGSIPAEFGSLGSLQSLVLSFNSLTGLLPDALSNIGSGLQILFVNDNNLTGAIPSSYSLLTGLTDVDFSNNNFDLLPDFITLSEWSALSTLLVDGNRLQFSDFEPYLGQPFFFSYSGQQPFGSPYPEEQYVGTGENITLSFTPTGPSLAFLWMKDNVNLPGETTASLNIASFAAADTGTYVLKVASALFPGDTLFSAPRTLKLLNESYFTLDRQNAVFGAPLQSTAYAQAWADIDLDGDDDLFVGQVLVGSAGFNNKLYENNGNGTFTELVNTGDLALDISDPRAASWADINNDGYPDIFVGDLAYRTGAITPAPIQVFVNNQDKTFTAIALPPVANLDNTEGGSWGDYDSDGFVDLAVWGSSNAAGELTLFRNNGDLTFSEVPGAFNGLVSTNIGTLTWVDVDNNGTLDVYYSTTAYRAYFQNNGDGTFTQNIDNIIVTEVIGSSRGHAWADINNDGFSDLIQFSQFGQTKFFFNDGTGDFTVVDDLVATGFDISARGATTGDIDNDGDIDLITLSSDIAPPIFLNNGTGNFTKVTEAEQSTFETYIFGAITMTDFTGDGFLDFLHYSEQLDDSQTILEYNIPRSYINNAASGNNWIRVKLNGTISNPLGIGAKVSLQYAGGSQHRSVSGSSGFGAQNSMVSHFGIGAEASIASIRVAWPSGIVDEILNPVINSTITFNEGTLAAPTSMRAITLSESSIQVEWAVSVANPGDQIVIERAEIDAGPFTIIDTLAEGTTEFVDSALVANKIYYYRTNRINGGISSGYSLNAVAATFTSGLPDTWRMLNSFITANRLTLVAIEEDALGNTFLAGNFLGPIIVGDITVNSAGSNDAVVIKVNAANQVEWAKAIGGVQVDIATDLAVSPDGTVYVAGYYYDSFTVDGQTATIATPGVQDAFVMTLSGTTGEAVWLTTVGAVDATSFNSIALDASNNAYLAGYFNGNVTFGASSMLGGGPGLFKVAADGSKVLGKSGVLVGPTRFVNGFNAVRVSGDNVFVAGEVDGDWSFDGQAIAQNALRDAVVINYATDGTLKWVKTLAGEGEDFGNELAVDGAGNVFVAGYFNGATATVDATVLTNQGTGYDLSLLKLSGADGSVLWGTSAGTADETEIPYALASDGTNVFMAGTMGYGATAFQGITLNNGKLFLASYDGVGNVRWADKSEGSLGVPWDITYSAGRGGVLMTGSFEYTQRFGIVDLTSQGSRNGFLAFHNDSGLPIPAAPSQFKAFAEFNDTVGITWSATPGIASYRLEKSEERMGPFTEIAVLPDTIVSYSDVAVKRGATYYYRIRSEQTVLSDYSATLGVYTFSNSLADSWDNVQFFRGKGRENFLDLAIDSVGSSYLVGYTTDSLTIGGQLLTSNGLQDLLVVKLDSSGNFVWGKTFGSTGSDLLEGVQVDNQGNVYVVGSYQGEITIGSQTLAAPPIKEAVLIKINSLNGDVVWVRNTTSTGGAANFSVDVDADGRIYAAGYFDGDGTHGSTTMIGGGHAMLIYEPDGTPVSAIQGALISPDALFVNNFSRVKVNAAGIYLMGNYSNDWQFGSLTASGAGDVDFFVSHYGLDGQIRWLRTFAGAGYDTGRDIALDAAGDVYVLGFSEGASVQVDTISVSVSGKSNLIAKLNGTSGAALWGRAYGSPDGGDFPFRLAANAGGFIVAGAMGIEMTEFGGIDVGGGSLYLTAFDPQGTPRWVDIAEGPMFGWALGFSGFHNAAVVAGGVDGNSQMGSSRFENVVDRDLFVAFHGESETPTAPAITHLVPANATTAFLQWTAASNASSYLIQGKLLNSTDTVDVRVLPFDSLYVLLPELLADSIYQVRVVAFGNSITQHAASGWQNVSMKCTSIGISSGDYKVSYQGVKRDGVIIPAESSFASIFEISPGNYLVNGLTGGYYQKYFDSGVVIDTLGRQCNIISKASLIDPTGVVSQVNSVAYAVDSLLMEYKTAAGDKLTLRYAKTASQIDSTDVATLVKLYDNTGGDSWTNKENWKSALPVGFWNGVETSEGRVVSIVLPQNNLVGELPVEIFAMDSLHHLNLGGNQLTGSIPSVISGLRRIDGMYLNDNLLQGEIPSSIGLLKELRGLDLGRNKFVGALPESIGELINLEQILGAAGNELEGNIPPSIGNLTNLKLLALDANKFEGTVPAEVGKMAALEQLYLHQNVLSGPLSDSLANLKKLKVLYLHQNQLEGQVPAGIATIDSLQQVVLHTNRFTFVPNFAGIAGLDTLNIANNKVGFGSIEPNLGVSKFVYAPQGRFGLPVDTLHNAGEAFTFVLTMGGSTNSYQWFKDSAAITGATERDYFLSSAGENDEGNYFARVTNASVPDLTLDTDEYILKISSRKRDSLALVAIYEGTGGPTWVNNGNWLQGELSTWDGITLAEGRVSEVRLPNNRVTGPMPTAIRDIGEVTFLDFSNTASSFDPAVDNQISFLPDLGRLTKVDSAKFTRNRLGFVSIEANLAALGGRFLFNPQRRFGETTYDSIPAGTQHRLAIEVSGSSNSYQWYFNDEPIAEANSRFYIIDQVTYERMGAYYAEVTSSAVPDFSIRNRNQNVLGITTVQGNVALSADQSPMTLGAVSIYQIKAGPYDSIATVQVSPEGSFSAEKIVLGDYVLLARPDRDAFPSQLQTYFSSTLDWLLADTLRVRASVANLPISLLNIPLPLDGDGVIKGELESDIPVAELVDEESRILDRQRVRGAGVTVSRPRFRAKDNEDEIEYELVAYTETDENGSFSIGNLPDGDYLINIQYPGVPMDQSSDIILTLGTETDQDEITIAALVTPTGIVVEKVAVKGIPAPFIKDLNVYPNPGEEFVNIDFFVRRKAESLQLSLTDVTGRQLLTQELRNQLGPQRTNLDISKLAPGVYILTIGGGQGSPMEAWRVHKK